MMSTSYQNTEILATITYEEHSFYDTMKEEDQRRYIAYLINSITRAENGRISQLRRRRKIV